MKLICRLLWLPLILFYGCHAPAGATVKKDPGFIYSEHASRPVIDKKLFAETTEVVPIDSVFVVADALHIITPKINGCNADNFSLMWDGVFKKDKKPVKTTLKIFEATDVACHEKHGFHLIYNLKPLQQKADSGADNVTVINFGNYGQAVSYRY